MTLELQAITFCAIHVRRPWEKGVWLIPALALRAKLMDGCDTCRSETCFRGTKKRMKRNNSFPFPIPTSYNWHFALSRVNMLACIRPCQKSWELNKKRQSMVILQKADIYHEAIEVYLLLKKARQLCQSDVH